MTEIENVIKVMHISEATSGGVFTHLNQLGEYLCNKKFKQTFILSSVKNPTLRDKGDFHGHKLHIVDMAREINPFKDILSLIKICKIIKAEQPDVVHCHSSKAGVIGRLAAILTKKCSIVYSPHAFAFHSYNHLLLNLLYKSIERILSRITDVIICVSEGEYKQAVFEKISKLQKLIVIRNGISKAQNKIDVSKSEWLINQGFKGSEKIIGFVGRLSRQKDPLTFIEACLLLNQKDIIFTIIGDGPYLERIDKIIRESSSSEQFLLLGYQENPRELTRYFDICVSSSLWEAMPYSILEAMKDKIPIIATKIRGVTDIIIHDYSGLLFEPRDSKSLASNIKQILNDEKKRIMLSENSKSVVNKDYTLEQMINRLEEVYSR